MPVGKQVNFYLLPSDFTTVQAAIESAGPVKFLTDQTRDDRPREIDSLVINPDEMGRIALRVYAVRPADLHSVKTKWIEQQGHWIIDQFDSPVLEIDRCYYDGRLIRRGRIYFATDLRFRPALPDKGRDTPITLLRTTVLLGETFSVAASLDSNDLPPQ